MKPILSAVVPANAGTQYSSAFVEPETQPDGQRLWFVPSILELPGFLRGDDSGSCHRAPVAQGRRGACVEEAFTPADYVFAASSEMR